MVSAVAQVEPQSLLKLDLGCGKNKREGFLGVDCRAFEGVDRYCDLSKSPWTLEQIAVSKERPPEYKKRSVCDQQPDGSWIWTTVGASPVADACVEEVNCSHFVEHLKPGGRINFINELYRVLVPGGRAVIVTPHWASNRAYGDLTHEWPPVSEMWFYYLNKAWRQANAPHNDFYICDFDFAGGYMMRPELGVKNQEYQQFALSNYKEAALDTVTTVTKPLKPR